MTTLCKQLVASKLFHYFIIGVIMLAGVVAGLETSPSIMTDYGALLHSVDKFILMVFIVEAVLKISSFGRQPWRYFRDGWNVFDFLILVFCLVPAGGPFAVILRLSRALRLLRLISALPKLQLLVGALLKSLSAMGYVSMLLGLLFYIYAVAGIHLFGQHDPQHFGSLPAAFLSLFRLVTLDNWADLFNTQLLHVPGFKVALYFVTFILFGTMIIMNLFIGIIMNSMSEMHAEMSAKERTQTKSAGVTHDLAEELKTLEEELDAMKTRLSSLRGKVDTSSGGSGQAPAKQSANTSE
jgi:voltage-gated sodium channel